MNRFRPSDPWGKPTFLRFIHAGMLLGYIQRVRIWLGCVKPEACVTKTLVVLAAAKQLDRPAVAQRPARTEEVAEHGTVRNI
jgi:hypothetical protein